LLPKLCTKAAIQAGKNPLHYVIDAAIGAHRRINPKFLKSFSGVPTMKHVRYLYFSWVAILVLGLTSMAPPKVVVAQATPQQPGDRPPLVETKAENGPPGAVADENGQWRIATDRAPVQAAATDSTGGPDAYGYTWDDSVPLAWINATGGTDTGLSGDSWDQRTGAIPLPFAFKYYEGVYTNIYISAAGFVTFLDSPGQTWPDQVSTPRPSVPNAVISAFSTPLTLAASGASGRVFYQAGGAAPNRYFVVTWNEVRREGEDDQYTFQIVLYENGDILFQYRSMTWGDDGWYYCGYVGIEDGEGLVGLDYSSGYCVPSSIRWGSVRAIRFTRPAATERVRLTPRGQGRFTRAARLESFDVTIHNIGELGADAYNLTINSPWPATIQINGQAPTDTNGDGIPDTGALEQGERKKLTIQVQTPAVAHVADVNSATLTARSTRNAAVVGTTLLRSTVPAPFAQIYHDNAEPAVRLKLLSPDGQITRRVTNVDTWSDTMAVSGTPDGGYLYAWAEWSDRSWRLRYAMLDKDGILQGSIRSLATTDSGWFSHLAAATAPNGNVALSWVQRQWREVSGEWQSNHNVWLSILDATGNVVSSPTNLTNNDAWTTWDSVGVPQFYYTQIAASQDDRFFVAWNDYRVDNREFNYTNNLSYTVRTASGQVVKPVSQLGGVDLDSADEPRLTALDGNRFLLGYYGYAGATRGVRVVAFSSAGDLLAGPVMLSQDYESPGAVTQLSNGSILLVWQGWTNDRIGLHYALLSNTSYTITHGPFNLNNPFSFTGDLFPSVVADANNRAVITWGENDWNYRRTLFYALIGGDGALLAPPTPWLTARTPADGSAPSVMSSTIGYGVARSNSFAPTSSTEADVRLMAPTMSTGAPNGSAQIGVAVSNRGLPTADGVKVTVELDPMLTLIGAEPPPDRTATASAAVDTFTWEMSPLRFLSQGLILINTGIPSTTVGSSYPVTITVEANGADANQTDNTTVTTVMAAEQFFLPLTNSSED
jgi:hypothetical protein